MLCNACGSENPDRAKFCLQCGIPASARCEGCNADLPPEANFCGECEVEL